MNLLSGIRNIIMYKNIIFDVGGVLLSYDWRGAMAKAGCSPQEAETFGPNLLDDPLWPEFDLGIRPYDDIVEDMCIKYPDKATIIRNFLTNLENMPVPRPSVWEEVKKLKDKGYKLYILSNYSKRMFDVHAGTRPFIELMDGIMVSYMVNINKPDSGIYEALLKKYDLDPAESLFFDDKLENIEGAKRCGIDGIHVLSEDHLLHTLGTVLLS